MTRSLEKLSFISTKTYIYVDFGLTTVLQYHKRELFVMSLNLF